MTPEEADIAAAIAETPAECVYRAHSFQVTAPQPKRGQKLDRDDIFDEPESTITALAADFRSAWTKPGTEKVKTLIVVDGETWRITDAQLDSKKAGYVISLQSPET